MTDTVGAMYVRVLSDTSGIKGELEREYGKAGAKAASAFDSDFDSALSKRINKMRAFDRLDGRIKNWAREVATSLGDSLDAVDVKINVGDILSAAEIADLSERMKVPATELVAYLKKAMPEALVAAEQEQRASIRRLGRLREEEAQEERKRIKALADFEAKERARGVTKTLQQTVDETERIIKETYRTLKSENEKFDKDLSGTWRRAITNIDLFGKKIGGVQNRLRRAGTGGVFDTITNLLSGMLGAAYRVGRVVPKVFSAVGDAATDLGVKMMGMGGRFGQIGTTLSKFGGLFAKFGKSGYGAIAAIVVGLGVMQGLLSSISILVSTLTAGFVALGSALMYAVSNVALLVPIVGALGVGFAGMAIGAIDATQAVGKLWAAINETDPKKKAAAWKEYNRELAKLGPNARSAVQAMKPLVEEFTDLKKQAGEALFKGMADSLKKASPLVESVKNGLTGVAGAVGDVVDGFLALAQNTTFMSSFNRMWELSAMIIRNVGAIASDLFAGFTNFFAAIAPVVERFVVQIAIAADNFRKWTESEAGRQAILDFFNDAYEIGSQVWEVIKNLGGALFDLFTADATKDAAKDLLGFMNEEITKFRDWINEVSENGKLKKWFEDAKVVGKALWEVVKDIGKLFGDLNTDENRAFFLFLLSAIRGVIAVFRVMFAVGRAAIFALQPLLSLLKRGFDNLANSVDWVIDKVKALRDWIKRIPVVGNLFGGGGRVSGGGTFRAAGVDTQVGSSSLVTNVWNITTPGMDSRVVASQVMNRMAAMAG